MPMFCDPTQSPSGCAVMPTTGWKLYGLSNDSLAERVRTDSIDILVDLAGHTGRNRLAVFARKPAPIQVTWLGYPNTTGLDAIDYRLVDSITDPSEGGRCLRKRDLGQTRRRFSLLCRRRTDAPMPSVPPCLTSGHVTLGRLTTQRSCRPLPWIPGPGFSIICPSPDLLLKGHPFADAATRAYFLSRLGGTWSCHRASGIGGWAPSGTAHLGTLRSGGYCTRSVSLQRYDHHLRGAVDGRSGGDAAGRSSRKPGRGKSAEPSWVTELIADSMDDYLEIAAKLAGHPSLLTRLRHSLRPRVAASPLCDGPAFARKIEAAYRAMWLRWCETYKPTLTTIADLHRLQRRQT